MSEVPYFMEPEDWWPPFKDWCVKRGFYPFYMPEAAYAPAGYAIMCGPAPQRSVERPGVTYAANALHAVVARDGAIVHDPNPERTGLVEAQDYVVLVALAAAARAA